jgi:uncharacterized protein (DUF1800 family)
MDTNTLWSLRLGFSAKQANLIENQGIEQFLKNSFAAKTDISLPDFLNDQPKNNAELTELKQKYSSIKNGIRQMRKIEDQRSDELKSWWIDRMVNEQYPLREKITVFWHNHYVATFQKIHMNYWVYTHNMVLRENAFGNYRELTKKVLKTNAMIKYLDNGNNKKGNYNENLSRELLELFTLGIGNYNEQDIKNGAKGLAGLSIGNDNAVYKPKYEDNIPFTYFEKIGNFKSDEMVDIIFQQKNAPYFITRKILKWFIYDNPPEKLVIYYGDYFREQDYEIQPLLNKIVTEELNKPTAGSKIKDPLAYILQLMDELNIKNQDNRITSFFLRDQGMDLFNQPNVKGWPGGNSWLTVQLYLQRNLIADQFCKGQNIKENLMKAFNDIQKDYTNNLAIQLTWNKKGNNKDIIEQLKNRLLFQADEKIQKDFENILKYDFDPNGESADNGVLRLFNYIVKTPEFQLI